MAGNPLVAQEHDTTTPFSGAGLLDDGASLASAIQSGDWVQGGIAAFSEGMDIAAAVSDPIGTLIANGLGWLIDHFQPLKGWFDDLTGDKDEVAAFAQTWNNIGQALHGSSTELTRILTDLDDLHGQTIDAYRRFQTDSADHIHAAGDWANAIATGLTVASTIVGLVHDLVRDAISQLVGSAISWAAEEVFSFGLATPWVVEQVSTRCASLAEKIGTKIPALVKAIHTLAELLDKLKALFSKGSALVSKLVHGGKKADEVADTAGRASHSAIRDADGGAESFGNAAGDDDIESLTRFFGPDLLHHFVKPGATFGPKGQAMFVIPDSDSRVVKDGLDAAIHTGMAPSTMKAWQNGQDIFGITVPRDAFPEMRVPTAQDANGWMHYLPGGHTAVNVGGEWMVNSTREFVVDGGKAIPAGSILFQLREGGTREVIGIYG